MKTPVILRIFKGTQLVEVKQFDLDQIIIGREAEVQVDLADPEVSPIHCLIELRDSGYYICDLGSQSGTFKNSKAILDEPLSSGDKIQVGPFSLQFFVGVPKPKNPPLEGSVSPPPPVAPAKPEAPQPQAPRAVESTKAVETPKIAESPKTSETLKAAEPPKLPEQPAKAFVSTVGKTKSKLSESKKSRGAKTFCSAK